MLSAEQVKELLDLRPLPANQLTRQRADHVAP